MSDKHFLDDLMQEIMKDIDEDYQSENERIAMDNLRQELLCRVLELVDGYCTNLQRKVIYGVYIDKLKQTEIQGILQLKSQSSISKALSNKGKGALPRLRRIASNDVICCKLLRKLRRMIYD